MQMGIDDEGDRITDEISAGLTIRRVTDVEAAALDRSIADEEEFDRQLGRLVRSMATLEDVIDDFLIEHLAPPWGRDIFWSQFLERRGISQKADDLRAITEFLPEEQSDRFSRIVRRVKDLAQQRNLLVHGIIEVGLPIGDRSTPFSVVRPQRDAGTKHETTVREMADLVEEVDSVIYEIFEALENPADW